MDVLKDGTIIGIAGEQTYYWDNDSLVHNDVIVIKPDGQIIVYGYPELVFPEIAFHSTKLNEHKGYIDISKRPKDKSNDQGILYLYRLFISDFHIESRYNIKDDDESPSEDMVRKTLGSKHSWLNLANDTLCSCFVFLDTHLILRVKTVCKKWNLCTEQPWVWKMARSRLCCTVKHTYSFAQLHSIPQLKHLKVVKILQPYIHHLHQFTFLHTLEIHDDNLFEWPICIQLGGQLASLPTLNTLSLQQNNINNQGMVEILSGAARRGKLRHLTRLDLSWNRLEGSGIFHLILDQFSTMSLLLELNLAGNELHDAGTRILVAHFHLIPLLQHLDLWSNNIGLHGLSTLIDGIHRLPQLISFDIGKNMFDVAGLDMLASHAEIILSSLPCLKEVNLQCNGGRNHRVKLKLPCKSHPTKVKITWPRYVAPDIILPYLFI